MFLPGLVCAALLGGSVSCLELLSSKYQNTFGFLLGSSRALYLYGLYYGILAGIADLALDGGVLGGVARVANGQEVTSPWAHALLAGVATKAFMQLNLFTLALNSTTSMPVGLQTFTQILERPLIRHILLDEFGEVRAFVEPYSQVRQNLEEVRALIKKNTPPGLQGPEEKGFAESIDKAGSPLEAMELFIRFVGVKPFRRVFQVR